MVAAHQRCGLGDLLRLVTDNDLTVRNAVAANTRTPAALLTRLAGDDEAVVRTAVAANPNTPSVTLETLRTDRSTNTRNAADIALRRRAADEAPPIEGLRGQGVAFTGSFRRLNSVTAPRAARDAGASPRSRIDAATTILVMGATAPATVVGPTTKSAKQRAAEEAGITVIDELRFIEMLPGNVRDRYLR